MPYITREDGIHFVIPSYRDVLIAKKSAIAKEVIALSQSYGEYITMQRKGLDQYEVAFSPDAGYSLGETVWYHFNRPVDMIYCEQIPNTSEAILVIVKGSSVYLDGSFPVESIPEELVIFLTQQNNFEIFIHGDVPISEKPTEGKFSFEPSSVKSFKVLDEPVFKNLPLLKAYNFQLVDVVLKEQGIGVFPVKQLVMVVGGLIVAWVLYSMIFGAAKEEEVVQVAENPYEGYVTSLASPAPEQVMDEYVKTVNLLLSAPGWSPSTIVYKGGSIDALMVSAGNSIDSIIQWSAKNNLSVKIRAVGIVVSKHVNLQSRRKPKQIFKMDDVLANFIDNLAKVYPGNNISMTEGAKGPGVYTSNKLTIGVSSASPMVLTLIGEQFKGLPLNVSSITMAMTNESLTGSIELEVLGN